MKDAECKLYSDDEETSAGIEKSGKIQQTSPKINN